MILIAIDPDVDGCGVATLYGGGSLHLDRMQLHDLFDYIKGQTLDIEKTRVDVIIEAGWIGTKNKSWHGGGKGSAYDVGRNHEIGMQIEKFCKANGIKHHLMKPKGYSSMKHEAFCKITGYKGRTNSETRVAGMFAFIYYPILSNERSK